MKIPIQWSSSASNIRIIKKASDFLLLGGRLQKITSAYGSSSLVAFKYYHIVITFSSDSPSQLGIISTGGTILTCNPVID